jgi:uracil-DNA glycosylase
VLPINSEPFPDCFFCPRLAEFRQEWQKKQPLWHNAPVPTFRAETVKLLIVGLAPGLQGANRTGRPFTGDWAGDLLYETLLDFGFASGAYAEHADDGLRLVNCAITNAVRCVPPQNKPTPAEITSCRPFLQQTIAGFSQIKVILALGRIAHESTLRALNLPMSAAPFKHGGEYILNSLMLIDSYHCSRYNTNTGRLTRDMFRNVFASIKQKHIDF